MILLGYIGYKLKAVKGKRPQIFIKHLAEYESDLVALSLTIQLLREKIINEKSKLDSPDEYFISDLTTSYNTLCTVFESKYDELKIMYDIKDN